MISNTSDLRLIEHGFPCHQVGAQTRRERDGGNPPVMRLHVWWARRPLTPSRAAILASLAPADTDTDKFVRELGIEKKVVEIGGNPWVLTGKLLEKLKPDSLGNDVLTADETVCREFDKEGARRAECRETIRRLRAGDPAFVSDPLVARWEHECQPFKVRIEVGQILPVRNVMADPDHVNARIEFKSRPDVVRALSSAINWDPEDLYGYSRGYSRHPLLVSEPKVVLDPTSGGGSIPFEAIRCGHQVIANELNPVATTILRATLDYPVRYGIPLAKDIQSWGEKLHGASDAVCSSLFPESEIPNAEKKRLALLCQKCPEIVERYAKKESIADYLYTRTVTCPHCGGVAPLLNTCWLSKEASDQWGVKAVPQADRSVTFEVYRCEKGRGPEGEDPEPGTVARGTGQCLHCKQAIDGDEIKAQARGESRLGKWRDTLYAVVAVRHEPVLDKQGQPVRYATGERKGEIKTRKVRFFRPPNARDLAALAEAEKRLAANWDTWEAAGLIPTEKFPEGNDMRPKTYGMPRWCDLFTPRQLLGHVTLIEELNRLKPEILAALGPEKGKAVVTYLQFAIDKGVDYNCRQTRWHFGRGVIVGTFGRHDFSLKWTFGEMIFTGPASGFAWGLSQVVDSYSGIAELVEPAHAAFQKTGKLPLQIINGSAAHMAPIADQTVDLVCMDPPYYDNVQYAELSDFYYVWQRRTLRDLYPEVFSRRLTNKEDEAVANPVRDGSANKARDEYERMMREIFGECRRVVKDDGIMTMMFTHKSQEAWEALTKAIIESGWMITASFPVDSEAQYSTHQMDMASAASSIFIACRKRGESSGEQAVWEGFGGTGVAPRIREEVRQGLADFARLRLNPVDEMIASYGRALRVLSENWPVLDGDTPVTPIRAMNEASIVVAQNQVTRITKGALAVSDLSSESAMALTLFGIFGHNWFPYDEALGISKALGIALENKAAGYEVQDKTIGINPEESPAGRNAEEKGFHAPLVRKGSKLRLATPEERNERRIKNPQSEWDLLHGLLRAHRLGDIPVARAYLDEHAPENAPVLLNLLEVWSAEIGDAKLQKEAKALAFGLAS